MNRQCSAQFPRRMRKNKSLENGNLETMWNRMEQKKIYLAEIITTTKTKYNLILMKKIKKRKNHRPSETEQ
jgi:hypothetical protein